MRPYHKSPILQALWERKSTRAFLERPIEEKDRAVILEAAMQAPTAGCQQLYTILDIRDQAKKERLSVTCDNQPFIAKAPMLLIFLADCRRWLDSYIYAGASSRDPSASDLILACADAFCAAQNSVIAAQALGIGSCYIGDIMEQAEIHKELLSLDDFVFPAAMVVYGYPAAMQEDRRKPQRFSREYIVFEDVYRRLSTEEHKAMFTDREAREGRAGADFSKDIKAFCERKYMSDFALEMARSVQIYLTKFK